MKRTISINISGILFHVEEDGYDLLKDYLATINRYFSGYEDSHEITHDIESRIAEVFLTKLSPSQQVITRENVETVITAMGSVEDFAAEAVLEEEPVYQQQTAYQNVPPYETEERKRLFRDTQRKILGGVAAGVAHYFKTDPLWVRVLLLLLLFTDAFVTFGALSSVTLITYIVLWIVLPGRDDLTLDAKIKKLFRNPDDQVLGGVCGGIAAYFGLDTTLIRILFVASIFFGGAGFIAYIVLWIITPPAVSLTDKMQMKGEPVTLSNIESSIKKNFRVNDSGEASTLLKAVLFPFRLFSALFTSLGKAARPLLAFLGDAARVLVGLGLILAGGTLLLATLGLIGGVLGFATLDPYNLSSYNATFNGIPWDVPWEVVQASVPVPGLIFALVVLFIPALGLVLAGISTIAKRRVVGGAVGWSALGVWIIALVGCSVTLVPIVTDFKEDARYSTTETLDMGEGTPVLTLAQHSRPGRSLVQLTLLGHEDSTYQLKKTFEARGRNQERALDNARTVSYELQHRDSTLIFPAAYTFREGGTFRVQEVDLTLYMPYGRAFMIDQQLAAIMRKGVLYRSDLSVGDLSDNTFMFTQSGLECTTCEQRENLDDQFRDETSPVTRARGKGLSLAAFSAVAVDGPFRLIIKPGDSSALIFPKAMTDTSRLKTEVANEVLTLSYSGQVSNDETLDVLITTPSLTRAVLGGNVQARIDSFSTPAFTLDLSGSSHVQSAVQAESTFATLQGTSQAKLIGPTALLNINTSGATQVEALATSAQTVNLTMEGASRAQVSVSQTLNATLKGAATATYQGNPSLNVPQDQQSKLRQESPE